MISYAPPAKALNIPTFSQFLLFLSLKNAEKDKLSLHRKQPDCLG